MSKSDTFGWYRCRVFWCCCRLSARTKFILMPTNMRTTIGIMFFLRLIARRLRIVTRIRLKLMQPLMLLSWLICTISFVGIPISDFSTSQNFFIYVEPNWASERKKPNIYWVNNTRAHTQNWICISHFFQRG